MNGTSVRCKKYGANPIRSLHLKERERRCKKSSGFLLAVSFTSVSSFGFVCNDVVVMIIVLISVHRITVRGT
jgi:hypothetical protein